ncbi:MAG: enoyl-CoA hydratase [Chloroflexi bacterium]|nr:MAG: enoyl-CoA hydratase [Chloroflexota bacterium]
MPPTDLTIDRRDAILVLTLNRPEDANRINEHLASALRDAFLQADQDERVRVVVVTGVGPVFSEGSSISLPEAATADLEGLLDRHTVARDLARVTKPVIAAINGSAFDQGLELALACDIRLASEEASLGFPMTTKGELPWDGGTQRLPRIAGRATAMDLLLTGRTVDATQALRLGLVHQVLPTERVWEEALSLAARIARQAPIATRYAKEAVIKGLDMPLEPGLRLEADLSFLLHNTGDRAEGLRSFSEKRDPEFRGE